jgi:GDSL-like Lipase/Acylhydrolase family
MALVLMGSLVGLIACELGLRLLRPGWVIPYPPVCPWSHLYERFDPYGYRLLPSRGMRETYPRAGGRTVAVTSNSDGFRNARDFGDRSGGTRIVVLGDSMVYGPGVEASERFTERLENAGDGWRVENVGMVGYGPDLMLRAYEQLRDRLAADVVLVVLFSHDLYRVMPENTGVGFPLPRFQLTTAGALETVPYPSRPFWKRLFLVQGARYFYWRYTDVASPLDRAILDRLLELVRTSGAEPGIVFAPAVSRRFDDDRRRAWLRRYASERAVSFLDLTEPLEDRGGPSLYLPQDAHWNPEGQRAVAELLRPFVSEMLSTSRRAGGSGRGAPRP